MTSVGQMLQYPLVEVLAKSWGSLWISNLCLVLSIALPIAASWVYDRHLKKKQGLCQLQAAAGLGRSTDAHDCLDFKPLDGEETPRSECDHVLEDNSIVVVTPKSEYHLTSIKE